MIKNCQTCNTKFDGRRDAKTCSVRCRKRLQRAKTAILHEAGVLKQDAEQVINTLKGEIIPVNLQPATALAETDSEDLAQSDEPSGFEDSNWQPQYLDLASAADLASLPAAQPIAGIGHPRPSFGTGVAVPSAPLPASAQPPVPTNEQLTRTVQSQPQPAVQPEPTILSLENTTSSSPLPPAPVSTLATPTPSATSSLPTPPTAAAPLGLQPAASFNFPPPPRLNLRTRLQALLRNTPAATLAALVVVMLVGGTFGVSKLVHQSSRSAPVASSQSDTTLQADGAGKLTLNLDTVLAKGKTLTLGQLVSDPTSGILQLTGDLTASGTLAASGGSTFANNSGLVIDKVTVCTAAGCIPNVNIPVITGSSSTADGTAGAVALLNANQIFTGNNSFSANSTAAFSIQNATGTSNLLIADTTNTRIAIGQATAAYTLEVNGDINSTTGVRVGGALLCSASGCSAASGNANYIQNSLNLQTANFNIQTVATTSVTGIFRAIASQSADLLQLKDSLGTNVVTVGPTGNTLIQPSTNSISAFQVLNKNSTSHLIVGDTLNAKVAIALPSPTYTLDVGGDINSTTGLRVAGNLVCSTVCTPGGGSGDYVQNGTVLQSANFNIQSKANGSIAASIKGYSGQTANLLNLVSGDMSTNVVSFGASGQTVFQNSTNSITAFQIQNVLGNEVLTVDTSGSQVTLGKASTLSGKLTFYNSSGAGNIAIAATNPGASTYTITLPAETGTVCTTGSVCSGYVPTTGAYGYVLTAWHSALSPADSTTYYWGGSFSGGVGSTPVRNQMYIPKAGTIKRVDLRWNYTDGTAGFNTTVSLRLNNTTDTVLTSTLDLSAFPTVVNATGLSIAVVAGDYIELKYITPAWAPTNPTSVVCYATIYIE